MQNEIGQTLKDNYFQIVKFTEKESVIEVIGNFCYPRGIGSRTFPTLNIPKFKDTPVPYVFI